jgi:uncharacterized protein Yka (UPF0111/DUF47 family)
MTDIAEVADAVQDAATKLEMVVGAVAENTMLVKDELHELNVVLKTLVNTMKDMCDQLSQQTDIQGEIRDCAEHTTGTTVNGDGFIRVIQRNVHDDT